MCTARQSDIDAGLRRVEAIMSMHRLGTYPVLAMMADEFGKSHLVVMDVVRNAPGKLSVHPTLADDGNVTGMHTHFLRAHELLNIDFYEIASGHPFGRLHFMYFCNL